MQQEKIATAATTLAALIDEAFTRQGEQVGAFASKTVDVFHRGGKIILFGNGSLGAVADLIAGLFLHRLSLERPLLPAVSLCHDAVLATALARDGQNRQFFARQLQALAAEGDVVLAFGEGRRDETLEEALAAARQLGCTVALLTHGDGEPDTPPDFLFRARSDSAARSVEASLFFGHLLVELAEGELFGI